MSESGAERAPSENVLEAIGLVKRYRLRRTPRDRGPASGRGGGGESGDSDSEVRSAIPRSGIRSGGSLSEMLASVGGAETLSTIGGVEVPSSGSHGEGLVAVDGVSFSIPRSRTLALVGESGSGKTTIGRLVARLEEPDAGRILFNGEDWLALSGEALRRKRRDLQVVFQDPLTSLNPRMRAGDQIAEPLRVQRLLPRGAIRTRVEELLAEVGLDAETADRFPSDLSGGQRQRVAIARALATRPRLVVCDEPVSALDASIGAQIVNLLADLQRDLGLSYLFISHDVALVSRFADRIAVVYLGRIVEEGPPAEVVHRPLHPYTAALLSAIPDAGPGAGSARIVLPEEASAILPASGKTGCRFAPRCPIARDRCRVEAPPLSDQTGGRLAACFYPGELAGR